VRDFIKEIIRYLSDGHAIDLSMYQPSYLENSVKKRMQFNGFDVPEKYLHYLEQNEEEASLFQDSLQVSYSEFFRNSLTFSLLEQVVIPKILLKNSYSHRKEIRIWSAACASGQEAYSLAMILEELKNKEENKFSYRIFATDMDETEVEAARKGHFGRYSIDNLNYRRLNTWFYRQDSEFVISEELKENINFSVFNLFSSNGFCPPACIFGDFDLIICSNLLFYYNEAYRRKIIEKISLCLREGGFIVTGETERDIVLNYNFREVFPQSAIFRIYK
jgi:chemotaxis protein methyltransferase CheR